MSRYSDRRSVQPGAPLDSANAEKVTLDGRGNFVDPNANVNPPRPDVQGAIPHVNREISIATIQEESYVNRTLEIPEVTYPDELAYGTLTHTYGLPAENVTLTIPANWATYFTYWPLIRLRGDITITTLTWSSAGGAATRVFNGAFFKVNLAEQKFEKVSGSSWSFTWTGPVTAGWYEESVDEFTLERNVDYAFGFQVDTSGTNITSVAQLRAKNGPSNIYLGSSEPDSEAAFADLTKQEMGQTQWYAPHIQFFSDEGAVWLGGNGHP